MTEIKLGDEVQDTVTGFKGIVVGEHRYLYGCTRFSVQAKSVKNAKCDEMSFDAPQLKVVSKKRVKTTKKDRTPGGPMKDADTRR